jgi:hypothetical protein
MGIIVVWGIALAIVLGISSIIAAILYAWLRAISGGKFFYPAVGLVIVLVAGLVHFGFTVSMQTATGNSFGPRTFVGGVIGAALVFPALFGIPLPFITGAFAVPIVEALFLSLRRRVLTSDKSDLPRNNVALCIGLLVLMFFGVPLAWHATIIGRFEAARGSLQATGGHGEYRVGVLIAAGFVEGAHPAWGRIAQEKRLERLLFRKCHVTDSDLEYLKDLGNLRELTLENVDITDVGIERLSHLKGLIRLELEGTKVTDAGLVHLSHLKSLTRLGLKGTKVTDAGITHLCGLSQLKSVNFYRTRVDSIGVEELNRALPQCTVEWSGNPRSRN